MDDLKVEITNPNKEMPDVELEIKNINPDMQSEMKKWKMLGWKCPIP